MVKLKYNFNNLDNRGENWMSTFLKKNLKFIILSFSIIIIILYSFNFNLNNSIKIYKTYECNHKILSSYVNHSPIHLIGNAQIDSFCLGMGTDGLSWATAHKLQNYYIDAGGATGCIILEQINRYVIIKNCCLINEAAGPVGGIHIIQCSNIKIINCSIKNGAGDGIHIETSKNSYIDSNRIYNHNGRGIYFYKTNNTRINASDIYNNGDRGFALYYSNNNYIGYNKIHDNSGTFSYGIDLYYSNYCEIKANYLANNKLSGLTITNANNNTIWLNAFIQNSFSTTSGCTNYLDSDGLGNYWWNYLSRYPQAKPLDIVWDTPYNILSDLMDHYPLRVILTFPEHKRISLNGNAEIDTYFAGSGRNGLSWATAYMITNMTIWVYPLWGYNAIELFNSNRYIIFDHCFFYDSWWIGANAIYLGGMEHIRIQNCYFHYCYNSIYITSSSVEMKHNLLRWCYGGNGLGTICAFSSNNIIIYNNTIGGSNFGIKSSNINNFEITRNSIAGDIEIQNSKFGILSNNNILLNYEGIILSSKNISVSNNYINAIDGNEIFKIDNCSYNQIKNNTFLGLDYFQITKSKNSVFEKNIINTTLKIDNSTQLTIKLNNITAQSDFSINNLSNSLISLNIINIEHYGITMKNTQFVEINNNTLIKGKKDWWYYYGILIENSYKDKIINNSINGYSRGLYVSGANATEIKYNNIISNEYGMYICYASTMIYHNYIYNNSGKGVKCEYSDTSIIWMNNFMNNSIYSGQATGYAQFDNGTFGNFWSDYIICYPDAKNNGVFWDNPYYVPGSLDYFDYFPLVIWNDSNLPPNLTGPEDIYTSSSSPQNIISCAVKDNTKSSTIYKIYLNGQLKDSGSWYSNINITYNFGQLGPGIYNVTIRVDDGLGGFAIYTYNIHVSSGGNNIPNPPIELVLITLLIICEIFRKFKGRIMIFHQ